MSLPAEVDPRFRRLGMKLGVFVGTGLLLGLGLLVALAIHQGYFAPKTQVYFQADTGTDLRPGMAVKLSGFKIGQVVSVELNALARVDVEMQIEERYMKWIKLDSMATLSREGLIGDSFINISSGNPALPGLTPEDRLRFAMGSSVGDIALDIRNRVVPVIDEMHKLLAYTNDPRGDVRATFREMRQFTAQLQDTRREVDKAIASINHLAADEAPATLLQTRTALARADASLRELEKAIPALSARTDKSLQSLDQATSAATRAAVRAEKLLDDAAPRVDGTLAEAELLLRDSRSAVGAARQRWPFRGPDVVPATSPLPAAEPLQVSK
jgi:phospholipid/cholesterol/gamma-HCH transport system substrate-binding protein